MTDLEVLTKARAFLADPDRWRQHDSVVDAEGCRHLALWEGEPAKCCAYGALARAAWSSDPLGWVALWEACGCSPIAFNDTHKHADVLAAFDRAIAALSSTESCLSGLNIRPLGVD